jgi:hypothetical protein
VNEQFFKVVFSKLAKVNEENSIVIVAMLGIRKDGSENDVYKLAKRLVKLGLLE